MEENCEKLPVNPNLVCKVCGEREFEEREGFYYCLECGTKQDQVRHIEIDQEGEFNEDKKMKKIKIHTVKAEKPQLTSWECYNYILRGYVEELLSFGAKEELKLMALQIWAAYLRRMEVAFFSKKTLDLPKLGIRYFPKDAETIYNHSLEARKKRKKKRAGNGDTSCTSGNESMSAKDFRRSKRKLDESIYSSTSASAGTGLTSSTSANSNRAIKLAFNTRARKILKRTMPAKHLAKHENDAEGLLTCHPQPKRREINGNDYAMMLMNMKHVYCVLAIALNLINDDIQLCDLLRFIQEGHIAPNKVLEYFPENIANNGKEMLRNINFYKNPDKYWDRPIRDHISVLCKNIGILNFKAPDIMKLVKRYVTELCLPMDIAIYVERLINILPPKFATRGDSIYPAYEARAMAYIVFVLKLLFGLDGAKELRMSEASQKLNRKIEKLNHKMCESQPLLFVWNDWVQYIEMRKVIVSHFNNAFCKQFNQCQSTSQLLQQMEEEMHRKDEQENLYDDKANKTKNKSKFENFKSLFERIQENFQQGLNEDKKPMQYIDFKPSFTPGRSYFKSILLHCDNENSLNSDTYFKIPDFMRIDHSQHDVKAYLKVKPLIKYFHKHQEELKVYVLPTNKNRCYVGMFRAPRPQFQGSEALITRAQKACFNISEQKWAENIAEEVVYKTDDLEFKTKLDQYTKDYYNRVVRKQERKTNSFNPLTNYDLPIINNDNELNNSSTSKDLPTARTDSNDLKNVINEVNDIQSMHSIDLFTENNMDPILTENFIKCPRRNLDQINLFADISDEESVLNEETEENYEPSVTAASLNGDFRASPTYSEDLLNSTADEFIDIKCEYNTENENSVDNNTDSVCERNINEAKTQKDNLKLFISNMDCWMLLGNILMLTKSQKTQLQDRFSRSFAWLIETCSQTICVEWPAVYEQLLVIETMFCMGIEDPEEIQNCVFMKSTDPVKDFQFLTHSYREIW